MNRPLILTAGVEAIEGQIGAFADTHAGVANQQKRVTTQIVAAKEVLLQELILLGGEGTGKSLRQTRNVRATDQMSEIRKVCRPSQFVEDAAQRDELVDIGCGRQRRHLRVQMSHPAEDVWLTAKMVQGVHVGVTGAEIG